MIVLVLVLILVLVQVLVAVAVAIVEVVAAVLVKAAAAGEVVVVLVVVVVVVVAAIESRPNPVAFGVGVFSGCKSLNPTLVMDDCGDTYEGLWLPRIANTRPQFLPPTTTLRNWQSSYWQWSS